MNRRSILNPRFPVSNPRFLEIVKSLAGVVGDVSLLPFFWRHACFAAEDVVELSVRREPTFGRNCFVAEFGVLKHQALSFVEAQLR